MEFCLYSVIHAPVRLELFYIWNIFLNSTPKHNKSFHCTIFIFHLSLTSISVNTRFSYLDIYSNLHTISWNSSNQLLQRTNVKTRSNDKLLGKISCIFTSAVKVLRSLSYICSACSETKFPSWLVILIILFCKFYTNDGKTV